MTFRFGQILRLALKHLGTVLLGVALCFMALLGLPDAAYQRAGPFATEPVLQRLRAELSLDRTPPVRFVHYWQRLLNGQLRSFYTQEPLREVLPVKIRHSLGVVVVGVAGLVVFTAAWFAAFRLFPRFRRPLGWLVGVSASVPVFLTATLFLYVCAVLKVPALVGAGLSLAVFPSLLLATNLEQRWTALTRAGYHLLAIHYRISAAKMAVRTAREFAPAVVLVGNALAFYLVAGLCIVELIFGVPGLGRWMLESLLRVDLPVIFLTGVVVTVSASLVLMAANAIALWADPRHAPRLAPAP
ncbi:MAG: hypothetical protein RMK20_07575 [Verrucomicrobiales bacterium]|nr:hypothetical protein [Verrucomicrobiales bacterium]